MAGKGSTPTPARPPVPTPKPRIEAPPRPVEQRGGAGTSGKEGTRNVFQHPKGGSGGPPEQKGGAGQADAGKPSPTIEQKGVASPADAGKPSPSAEVAPAAEQQRAEAAAIIEANRVLQKFPEPVRDFVQKRIELLPYDQQVGVARQINTWATSPELRAMARDLTRSPRKGIIHLREAATPAERGQRIIDHLNTWIEQQMKDPQGAKLVQPHTGDAGVDRILNDAQRKLEATQGPKVQDDRSPELILHDMNLAEQRFHDRIKGQLDKNKEISDRRKLYMLLGAQILVSIVHASVPPER